jgi:hypothetical protein
MSINRSWPVRQSRSEGYAGTVRFAGQRESLIFQNEIKQDVSRVDAKHQEKRKTPSATTPTARNIGIKLN